MDDREMTLEDELERMGPGADAPPEVIAVMNAGREYAKRKEEEGEAPWLTTTHG